MDVKLFNCNCFVPYSEMPEDERRIVVWPLSESEGACGQVGYW